MTKGQEIADMYDPYSTLGKNHLAKAIDASLAEGRREAVREAAEAAEAACKAYHDATNGCAAITAAILAVAKPQVPVWCSHMQWEPFGESWWHYNSAKQGRKLDCKDDADWTRCPICGAPRPEVQP